MEELKTTVIDYGDGIYAIDQQMVRAFLIVGEKKALLIDTGAIRVNINSLIREITTLPIEVILTHGDSDHIGNLRDFHAARMNEKDFQAVLSNEDCKCVEFQKLKEGDMIDIGGRILKTIVTPGHTEGSICILDEKNKILFAGDTISYGPIFMFGKNRNIEQYLSSLQKLKNMKDAGAFTTVYCCHNTCPISGDTVEALIACVRGIIDGMIERNPVKLPMQFEEEIFVCKYEKCAVLIGGRK